MRTYEFIRTSDGLMPGDEVTEIFLRKIEIGEVVELSHHKDRNIRKHRKFFAVLNRLIKKGGVTKYFQIFRTTDQLRFFIMQMLGVGEWTHVDGKSFFIPDSMKFDSMDEDTFHDKIFQPSIELLCDLFDIDEIELMDEY